MKWLIFGDDWGAHASTTQHLARAIAKEHQVTWIGSIGMRSPRVSFSDARRVLSKLSASAPAQPAPVTLRSLRLLPFHQSRAALALNRKVVASFLRREGPFDVIVSANPVAALLLPPELPLTYLRLDDYARLPGVDAALVLAAERAMLQRRASVAYTADALRLNAPHELYLPQGVDFEALTRPVVRARTKTIGFFGLLAEWVDVDLIRGAASALPDVRFEFVGPSRLTPDVFAGSANVSERPSVPFSRLPEATAHWAGAWIPFRVDALTKAVNPLKAREYLALGLPVFSTPLPEVKKLGALVTLGDDVRQAANWARACIVSGNAGRDERIQAMASHTWSARARELSAFCIETTPRCAPDLERIFAA